eukprot:1749897-Rhodomonas_salina.1
MPSTGVGWRAWLSYYACALRSYCMRYAMSGTDIMYPATVLCNVWYWRRLCCYICSMQYPTSDRATHALRDVRLDLYERVAGYMSYKVSPGTCRDARTDLAYGAVCLGTCYAMSGTEIAYGAICIGDVRY